MHDSQRHAPAWYRYRIVALLLIGTWWQALRRPRSRSGPVAEIAGGALLFADDGVVTEGFVGGAGRFYLSPRVSVGPEIAFISGENHSHLMLTGNVTFDFLGPINGQPRAVTPFAVVGGGLFRTSEQFPFAAVTTSTSSEGAFTAGGGVRGLVGKRAVAGVEARIGWETHIRLNGFVGVRFGS